MDRKRTCAAFKKSWNALGGILPQFVAVIVVVARNLASHSLGLCFFEPGGTLMRVSGGRWLFPAVAPGAFGVLAVVSPQLARTAVGTIGYGLREMLLVIPPVFILLGFLDVWVPREHMMRFMGPEAGLKGGVIAFVMGSAAAGPLYAVFPIAAMLIRKGAGLVNVFVFIGAWSTTKIPMFLFEYGALEARFAVTRLLVDIPGILIIAFALKRLLFVREIETLYERRAVEGAAGGGSGARP